jgi:NMD protein affecting ribosome stability and mRNA decay
MKIDFKKLEKAGFEVVVKEDGIYIYPRELKSADVLIDVLKEEYGIAPLYAHSMAEDLHQYQVLTVLKG